MFGYLLNIFVNLKQNFIPIIRPGIVLTKTNIPLEIASARIPTKEITILPPISENFIYFPIIHVAIGRTINDPKNLARQFKESKTP